MPSESMCLPDHICFECRDTVANLLAEIYHLKYENETSLKTQIRICIDDFMQEKDENEKAKKKIADLEKSVQELLKIIQSYEISGMENRYKDRAFMDTNPDQEILRKKSKDLYEDVFKNKFLEKRSISSQQSKWTHNDNEHHTLSTYTSQKSFHTESTKTMPLPYQNKLYPSLASYTDLESDEFVTDKNNFCSDWVASILHEQENFIIERLNLSMSLDSGTPDSSMSSNFENVNTHLLPDKEKLNSSLMTHEKSSKVSIPFYSEHFSDHKQCNRNMNHLDNELGCPRCFKKYFLNDHQKFLKHVDICCC